MTYLLTQFIQAQNFRYDPDDWYIITKPGSITAITEDNFNLYFATENGVYKYDKIQEDFQLDYTFAVQSENDKLTVSLKNDSHLPSNFINARWQGYYVTASARV